MLCCVFGVLSHFAFVHRCVRLVSCAVCAVSWAAWLLFTGVHVRRVVLRLWCPGPLGSCTPVRTLGVFCCVCGVLGHLAAVHQCVRSVCCVACAVSWATWPLFSGVLAQCIVLCVACAVSWATWLLFTGVRAGCVVLRVPGVAAGGALLLLEGGCFVAGKVCVPSGRAHVHPDGGCSVAGRGCVRCRVRTRPSGRQVLPGTFLRAVVRFVLCALSGFAAPSGRCHLAPVCVPWLWPAACLSGVPCGRAWCAAPRPVRSLSVLWSACPTPLCLSPPRGLSPRIYRAAVRGTQRPADNRAHCACRC